jgi:hypothetical protein
MTYHSDPLVVSQGALEPEVRVISPPVDMRVSSFVVRHVEISAAAITDVVREVIFKLWG